MNRISLTMAFGLLLLVQPAFAQGEATTPDATLNIEGTFVGVGIGFNWGNGTLTYGGKQYPISMKGATLVSAGISKTTITGAVYNLKSIDDFPGQYAAVKGGIALGGGFSGVAMRNSKGVVVRLKTSQQGLDLTLGPEGVTFDLKQ
jgi:hypothetical protein